MPGHVRAAMNWNNLKRMHGDNYSTAIVDGMKTIVCKLKENPLGYNSVGYPTDLLHIPQWFKDLPFDNGAIQSRVIPSDSPKACRLRVTVGGPTSALTGGGDNEDKTSSNARATRFIELIVSRT